MAYLAPAEFVTKMIDAGEAKIFMSNRDTLIRAYMAGAILALAAAFAITITVQTGQPLAGAILFPVGFCLLYLLGFDLLTGVFTLTPLALIDKRPGVTMGGVLRNWGLVFVGNFAGALTVALMMSIIFTYGFTVEPNIVGQKIGHIGEGRTLGYAEHGAAGMLTLFIRGVLCNWMVSTGVVGAMVSTNVTGKVVAMWMPIMLFFYMGFEHSIVNMYLFPSGLMLGGNFSIYDYMVWNELPTVVGNLVGGLLDLTGILLYPADRPAVAYSSSANYWLVTWQQWQGSTNENDVRACAVSNAGTMATAFTVYSNTGDDTAPDVAANGTQGFLVAWEREGTATSIYARRTTATSASLSVAKWLMHTTGSMPDSFTVATCASRFSRPFSTSPTSAAV